MATSVMVEEVQEQLLACEEELTQREELACM
jgi:hypothetical protein